VSVVVVHFPDGSREFRYPAKPPEEGDVLWHEGERYRVTHVAEEERGLSLTVEPDSDDLGDLLGSERGGIVLEPAEA
jgi:hypothetical protein